MPKLHRTELPYDPTPRAVAQASTLPLDALGVWVWARSLPDGAELSVDEVVAQGRGLGEQRAAKAVQALRAHGLWHTLTYRARKVRDEMVPDKAGPLMTSTVVVPPDPWTREQAAEALGLDPAVLVNGPSEVRHLRSITAGQSDTAVSEALISEALTTEGRSAEARKPGGDSSQNRSREPKELPPNPRSAGEPIDGCNQGHRRPVRGCCARADVAARRRAVADQADRDRSRNMLAGLRPEQPGNDAAGIAAARAELEAAARNRAAVNAAVDAMAERRALPR